MKAVLLRVLVGFAVTTAGIAILLMGWLAVSELLDAWEDRRDRPFVYGVAVFVAVAMVVAVYAPDSWVTP